MSDSTSTTETELKQRQTSAEHEELEDLSLEHSGKK